MQIGAAAGGLACWINSDPLGRGYYSDERAFRLNNPASHASTLGDAFFLRSCFFVHRHTSPLALTVLSNDCLLLPEFDCYRLVIFSYINLKITRTIHSGKLIKGLLMTRAIHSRLCIPIPILTTAFMFLGHKRHIAIGIVNHLDMLRFFLLLAFLGIFFIFFFIRFGGNDDVGFQRE